MTAKVKYNKKLLEQICERDKCIIDFDKIEKYNRDVRIEFICCCGNNCKKTLRCLYEGGGAHCQKCTEKLRQTKVKQKSLDKYGVEHFTQVKEIKDKVKQTCLNKYGVDCVLQSEQVKMKSKQTCLDKYGVEYPQQNAEVSERCSKSAYKRKLYTFPCNNTIQVQGYEPLLLDILVKEGYTFEDIITKRTEVPEIWYNKDDNKCRYYCDIYIHKINTIYEVKSTWTYKIAKDKIDLTKQACIDAEYNFELYVFDSKGIRQFID